MPNTTVDIGTTLAIATGLPATFTEAGYEAMTWTVVGGVMSISEIGDDNDTIDVSDLTTGRTRKIKGAVTGKDVSITIREITGDAGLTAVKAAAAAQSTEYSLKITDAAGVETFISGFVVNLKRNERSEKSYAGYSFDVTNNYGAFSGTV